MRNITQMKNNNKKRYFIDINTKYQHWRFYPPYLEFNLNKLNIKQLELDYDYLKTLTFSFFGIIITLMIENVRNNYIFIFFALTIASIVQLLRVKKELYSRLSD